MERNSVWPAVAGILVTLVMAAAVLAAAVAFAGAGNGDAPSTTAPQAATEPLNNAAPAPDATDGVAAGETGPNEFRVSSFESRTPSQSGANAPASIPTAEDQTAFPDTEVVTSSVSVTPTPIGSSWSQPPVIDPPADAPRLSDAALALVAEAGERWGIVIATEGQDWGSGEDEQVHNVGAVISAMERMPLTVASAVVEHRHGPLTVLSNRQGRTLGGWQPYGSNAPHFYTNKDYTAAGDQPANQVVLKTGATAFSAAHEILHSYHFRDVGPGEYALALLGDEMKSFMRATGWVQLVSDDDIRNAVSESWQTINSFYEYQGRPLTYVDQHGQPATLHTPNPLEAFAEAGALYYAGINGVALPDWTEHWDWLERNLR